MVEIMLIYPLLTPLIGAILITLIGWFKEDNKLLGGLSTASLAITLGLSAYVMGEFLNKGTLIYYFTPPPNSTCLAVDGLSAFMALLSSLIVLTSSVYSIGYLREGRLTQYYVLLQFLALSLIGLAYAGDYFTLFIFFEFTFLVAVALVAFYRSREALEASFKYFVMGTLGAVASLLGIAMIYGLTGTFNIALSLRLIKAHPLGNLMPLIFSLLFFGFGVEAAVVPLHFWLIDAHPAAPSSISAVLSGVVIKGGIYAILRTSSPFISSNARGLGIAWPYNISALLFLVGALTVTLPNLIALVQTDVKRLLAYSSVYNIGVITLGIAVGTPFALTASLFHLMNHAILKANLFLSSGAYIMRVGTRDLRQLRGIGRRMPFSATVLSLSSLSLAGLPPLNGFYSKVLIIWAALTSNTYFGLPIAVLLALNAAISMGYYVAKLIRDSWMYEETDLVKGAKEAPISLVISQLILLVLTIAISVFPWFFYGYINKAVISFLDFDHYVKAVIGG